MRQHPPTGHVGCRRQIHEAAPHGNVADVHRPHAWRNLAGNQIRRPVRHDLHLTGAAFPATKRRVFRKVDEGEARGRADRFEAHDTIVPAVAIKHHTRAPWTLSARRSAIVGGAGRCIRGA